MKRIHRWLGHLTAGVAALAVTAWARAENVPTANPKPAPNKVDEPKAEKLSLARAAEFLDRTSVTWTREKKCGSCHTNYPYLMARPYLKEASPAAMQEVRQFLENRAANWDRGPKGDRPRWDAEVVATAATLAFHDAQTTSRLHPVTRKALDKMWTVQKEDGAWTWLKCRWPPFEHDDSYGALLAALGTGIAPDGYQQTDAARMGLAKLRNYFQKNSPSDLHHKAWLMWASLYLDGLMTPTQRDATVKELLAAQRADGGWSLPSLGDWKGNSGRPNDTSAPSDGYGTGLVIYVLRQAGVPASQEPIQKGVAWLQSNQRASGRWFTRSLNHDRAHFITHTGTAFAVMALAVCER